MRRQLALLGLVQLGFAHVASTQRQARRNLRKNKRLVSPARVAGSHGRLLIDLIGPFELKMERGGRLRVPKKAQALLAFLALQKGRPIPRDQLATLLWGNSATEQARQSLRQCLAALRRAMGATADELIIADTASVLL